MRLLLDTHAFLWWLAGHRSLSAQARAVIDDADAEVFVSAASAWEISTKFHIGKLPEAEFVVADVLASIAGEGFRPLAVTVHHAQRAGALGGSHRDPFDRMLIAQALVDDLALVSNEAIFDMYGVRRVW